MTDLLKVMDIFLNKIKEDYADDVAIVGYYGSYAQGTQNPKSDLDIFFIPATERGWKLAHCFILDDIGMDMFAIDWDRANDIASFNETIVSVLADCKIIYYRSQEDLDKFEAIKEKVKLFCSPEKRALMRRKASDTFNKSFVSLYNLERLKATKDIVSARVEAFNILTMVFESLAMLNQSYFNKGWGKNLDQILSFEIKPDNLAQTVDCIITGKECNEIYQHCKKLVDSTTDVIKGQLKVRLEEHSFADMFTGYYEEMKSIFNKIVVSCENGDYPTAYFASILLQKEMAAYLGFTKNDSRYYPVNIFSDARGVYDQYDFPDLIANLGRDSLDKLKDAVEELDKKLVEVLKNNGVKIKAFKSLEQYEEYVKSSF